MSGSATRLAAIAMALVAVGITASVLAATLGPRTVGPGDPAPPTAGSGDAVRPPPVATPLRTSPPDLARTLDVPSTIDATGAGDVAEDLQAFIDGVPDHTLIRLAPGGRYRVDTTLTIVDRRGLTVDGRGATLFASSPGDDPDRSMLRIRSSRSIVVRDLSFVGGHAAPGTYVAGFEWQHGVSVEGGGPVELDRLRISRTMGDCVYVTSDDRAWAQGVWVHDSVCRDSGRQGVAIVAGRDTLVERSVFGGIPLSVLDLEPEPQGSVLPQGADGVVFVDNVVDGPVGSKLFNATGVGPVSRVLVEGTRVAGAAWGISSFAGPLEGSIRYRDIVFRDNRAEGAFVGYQHTVLTFADVDDLVIERNRQQIDSAHAAIRLVRSCNVILRGNDLAPVSRVDEEHGPCP